jgi:UDP-3-O-acyl-N-acetylglucosamine deacetylase
VTFAKRVRAEGVALFSGEHSIVEIERCDGPSILRTEKGGGPIAEWSRAPAFRTTTIAHTSSARVACVEHLFAALAAFRAHEGVSIFVRGAELPILDGASAAWCALLGELDLPERKPKLVVARDGEVAIDAAKYLFFSSETRSEISVEIDWSNAGRFASSLATRASWNGSRATFVSEVASARTFILARDLAEFEASGASAHVPQASFVVVGEENVVASGAPFSADEPTRHKLLDLIGDFFLHGGPSLGRVEALRPGHAKNHEAITLALEKGILARI